MDDVSEDDIEMPDEQHKAITQWKNGSRTRNKRSWMRRPKADWQAESATFRNASMKN